MFIALCFDGSAANAEVFTQACFLGTGFFILAPLTFHTGICHVTTVLSMANRPPSMARRHGPCFAPPLERTRISEFLDHKPLHQYIGLVTDGIKADAGHANSAIMPLVVVILRAQRMSITTTEQIRIIVVRT